jgi:hypothetical protein
MIDKIEIEHIEDDERCNAPHYKVTIVGKHEKLVAILPESLRLFPKSLALNLNQ